MKLCECGCGQPTKLAPQSDSKLGWVKGQPIRFILGHSRRGSGRPLLERLMEKLIWNGDEDECWEWQAAKARNGYGRISVGPNDIQLAHRVAYRLFTGAIPDGLCVLHRCDNPPCCNPGHLFLGTHADNVADAIAKGRNAYGERQGGAKLTEADIRAIRASNIEGRRLASQFGVSEGAISMIRSRKRWAHV